MGLLLRIHPDELAKDPLASGFGWTDSLYGDLLLILLFVTLVLAVAALLYQNDAPETPNVPV